MSGPFEAFCAGESMALVTPDPPGPLAGGGATRLDVAGAESTVACYLAQLGVRVAWASRVGDDPLGVLVRERIAGYGVDVSMVDIDAGAPTGVFFKDPGSGGGTAGTAVYYYRAGSAASRLGSDALYAPALAGCGLVHLTGITPALSGSCADLVATALAARPVAGAVYSFDVNHRPALWPAGVAGPLLATLANQADVAFVGLDEAYRLWGAGSPDAVRSVLRGAGTLVVKDGARGATSYASGRAGEHRRRRFLAEPSTPNASRAFVPAPAADVVEPVGAGDAFAAGYLFGLLRGLPEETRLRLGHLVALAALAVPGDVGPLPAADLLLARATAGGGW